jgi:hypothetical protein
VLRRPTSRASPPNQPAVVPNGAVQLDRAEVLTPLQCLRSQCVSLVEVLIELAGGEEEGAGDLFVWCA